jgi:hypothetical protein
MKAKMRFSAFKSRTTPIFTGQVVSLAPDIVIDGVKLILEVEKMHII